MIRLIQLSLINLFFVFSINASESIEKIKKPESLKNICFKYILNLLSKDNKNMHILDELSKKLTHNQIDDFKQFIIKNHKLELIKILNSSTINVKNSKFIKLDPNGKFLLFEIENKTRLINLTETIPTITKTKNYGHADFNITSLINGEFSEDSKYILIISQENKIYFIDLVNGREVFSLSLNKQAIQAKISPNNKIIFLLFEDHAMILYNFEQAKETGIIGQANPMPRPNFKIKNVIFTQDSKIAVTITEDAIIQIINLEKISEGKINFICRRINNLNWPNSKLLALSKSDKFLLAAANNSGAITIFTDKTDLSKNFIIHKHEQEITTLIFSKLEHDKLFSTSKDGSLVIWDFKDFSTVTFQKLSFNFSITSFALSADEKFAIAGMPDTIFYIDLLKSKSIKLREDRAILNVAFAIDQNYVIGQSKKRATVFELIPDLDVNKLVYAYKLAQEDSNY